MRYMLDTNVCVSLLRGKAPGLFKRLRRLKPDEAGISSITLADLQYGASKSKRPAHHHALVVAFCAPLEIAVFDATAAAVYGTVRATLEASGTPIGPLDTLIAAQALASGAAIVTSNVREFRRVAGLRVEDWGTS